MILPLPFGYFLFKDHKHPVFPWFMGVGFLAIASVIGMSGITSLVDRTPIFPQNAFEWREVLEYSASIAFSFSINALRITLFDMVSFAICMCCFVNLDNMESACARFSFFIDSEISSNSSVVSLMAEQTITIWFFLPVFWRLVVILLQRSPRWELKAFKWMLYLAMSSVVNVMLCDWL